MSIELINPDEKPFKFAASMAAKALKMFPISAELKLLDKLHLPAKKRRKKLIEKAQYLSRAGTLQAAYAHAVSDMPNYKGFLRLVELNRKLQEYQP